MSGWRPSWRTELLSRRNVDRAAPLGFPDFSGRTTMPLFWKHLTIRHSMIALGCLLFAAPALAQSAGEKTGVNSALGVSPTTPDFVKEGAISDMFGVEPR